MQTAPTSTPDPLLETQVFWGKYKTPIIVGLLTIVLVIGAIAAYRFFAARRNAAAAESLATAKGADEYRKVIAEYPTSGAASSAYLLLAAQQREKQQFAEANATLKTFLEKFPEHQLLTTAKMATAGNLESMGRPDEALEAYRRLAADYPKSFNAPLALLAQVSLLKQKGQLEDARRVCETVLAQYGESYAASEATRLLRTLKPASAPSAPTAVAAPPDPNAPASGASVPPVAASPAASVAPTR